MSHGVAGIYHGLFYGAVTLCFFSMLWRWRQWYVTAPAGASTRRSLWSTAGVACLFVGLWLGCGRTSMNIVLLQWVIPPLAVAGFAALGVGLRRAA